MITELSTDLTCYKRNITYICIYIVWFNIVCTHYNAKVSEMERFLIECRKLIIIIIGFTFLRLA